MHNVRRRTMISIVKSGIARGILQWLDWALGGMSSASANLFCSHLCTQFASSVTHLCHRDAGYSLSTLPHR
jgi:hypothetical protein